eukprot:Pgem_evm1s12168
MTRRAWWQLGNLIPVGPQAAIHAGLNFNNAENGEYSYFKPNKEILLDLENVDVAGLKFEFQLALNTEAPSEMHLWIEKYK